MVGGSGDEMGVLLQQVAEAVRVLNHDVDSINRIAANQWLVGFQQSNAAWEIAAAILTSPSPPILLELDLLFFAAQMLRRKIQTEGCFLQTSDKDALLNALFVAAVRFSPGPPQLLTQICLAISALALRGAEEDKPMEKLFSSISKLLCQDQEEKEKGDFAVLELLTVLPEEVLEDHNGSHSSCKFTRELLLHSPTILDFLLCQLDRKLDDTIRIRDRDRRILRCLLSWVRTGCFLGMSPTSIPTHPLLNFVFNSLQVSSSFDVAIEVLIELVCCHEGTSQILLRQIKYLKEVLLQPALSNKDEKIIGGLACLMSEIGQAAPALIAEASSEACMLADALLSCVAFPSVDWDISDLTLQFWCSLASYLLGFDAEKAISRKTAEEIFFPIFSALLDVLLLRAQFDDSNFDGERGVLDIPDGLAHFRLNMEELLVDICLLLGSSMFVNKIFSGGWVTADPTFPWIEVETRMFALHIVAETVMREGLSFDFSVIMKLVAALSSRVSLERKGIISSVYKSVADVVGSYAKWLSSSNSNIRPLLLFCATGIIESICSNTCAISLRKLCEDASARINEGQNLEILIWIGEGFKGRDLPLEEDEEIISAITSVICSVPNQDIKKSSLARLLSSSYEAIDKLVHADSEHLLTIDSTVFLPVLNAAIRGLHRVGTVFVHLGHGHSARQIDDDTVVAFLGAFWPLLEKLLSSSYMEHGSMATAACRSLSRAVHSSGEHLLMLLPKILDLLSKNFLLFQRHDCFIRAAAVVIEEFGHKNEHGPLFICTLERFTSATRIMALNSSYICDQEPDLVEAYTNFTSTFVCCCPKEVVAAAGAILEISLQKSAMCITAMHRGTALTAMSYISCFLEVALISILDSFTCIVEGSLSSVTLRLISSSGEVLISELLHALLGVSALSRVHKCATILQQLAAICYLSGRTSWKAVLCWESLCGWLQSTMQTLPSEYSKREAGMLGPMWLKALGNAASDYLESKRTSSHVRNDSGHMQGKGGRTLKRLIRDFVDTHQKVSNPA